MPIAVKWCAKLVRRHRQETRFGLVGRVRVIPRFSEHTLGLGTIGDVAADALQFCWMVGVDPHQGFAPCNPAGAPCGFDALIENSRAVRFNHALALLENGEREPTAKQLRPRSLSQDAIGIIDRGDGGGPVAQNDQIALRLEKAARALLRFLQFPIAISERFIVESNFANFLAHPAQAHALDR